MEAAQLVGTPGVAGPDQRIALAAVGPDAFLGPALGQSVAFVRDRAGAVVRFLHTGYAYERE